MGEVQGRKEVCTVGLANSRSFKDIVLDAHLFEQDAEDKASETCSDNHDFWGSLCHYDMNVRVKKKVEGVIKKMLGEGRKEGRECAKEINKKKNESAFRG